MNPKLNRAIMFLAILSACIFIGPGMGKTLALEQKFVTGKIKAIEEKILIMENGTRFKPADELCFIPLWAEPGKQVRVEYTVMNGAPSYWNIERPDKPLDQADPSR